MKSSDSVRRFRVGESREPTPRRHHTRARRSEKKQREAAAFFISTDDANVIGHFRRRSSISSAPVFRHSPARRSLAPEWWPAVPEQVSRRVRALMRPVSV